MKIYFAGSIAGGRDDAGIYQELIAHLSKHVTVLTEHVGDKTLSSYGENNLTAQEIYERDVAWIQESDAVVAEVTQVSLGVGYEIGYAEAHNKPIICLFRPSTDAEKPKRLSAMISGNSYCTVLEYENVDNVIEPLVDLLQKISKVNRE